MTEPNEPTTDPAEPTEEQQDGDTFPRAYVEKLRGEAKDNRTRAEAAEARADEVSRALFTGVCCTIR